MTFLAARKQGVTLQEDFTGEEDGEGFDLEFFKRKSQTSLEKCKHMLDLCGEDADSVLGRAVHEICN